VEGKKYNILANALLPTAGTQLTATVWSADMLKIWDAKYNAPLVGFVTSSSNTTTTGQIYHTTGGGAGAYRWQRSYGYNVCRTRQN
jgi:multifunctional beta-oxidation protein